LFKIAILPNIEKDKNLATTKLLCSLLQNRANVLLSNQFAALALDVEYVSDNDLFEKADIMLVLGGDGSLLHAAREASHHGLPLLGINLGRLGFLAQAEKGDISSCIEKILSHDYTVEDRMMLHVEVCHENQIKQTFDVLNDVVISRFTMARMINAEVYTNGTLMQKYTADGLIISTPTGSTAYCLSAGGPIIDPMVEAIITTAICPHNLNTRTVVMPPDKTVTVKLASLQSPQALALFDGDNGYILEENDTITITKSNLHTKLIWTKDADFYHVLHYKLSH